PIPAANTASFGAPGAEVCRAAPSPPCDSLSLPSAAEESMEGEAGAEPPPRAAMVTPPMPETADVEVMNTPPMPPPPSPLVASASLNGGGGGGGGGGGAFRGEAAMVQQVVDKTLVQLAQQLLRDGNTAVACAMLHALRPAAAAAARSTSAWMGAAAGRAAGAVTAMAAVDSGSGGTGAGAGGMVGSGG
ncbi:unnamed protein product, partial [Phaeothamnion confervicola]